MSTENHHVDRDNYDEDQISLYDLYWVLVKRKMLIGIICVLALIISVIYILVAPKVYQVKTIILPPTSGDVYLTNFDVSDDLNFKPHDIFRFYTQEIISGQLWSDFIQQHKEFFGDRNSNAQQESPFKLGKDKNFPGDNALISYDSQNRGDAASVFRLYLKFAEEGLIQRLTKQIKNYIKHREIFLTLKIQDERSAAKQLRLDKIVQLESDLAIAKKLGIVDNLYFHTTGKFAGNNKAGGVFNIFANNTKTPTYLRGTKVITAELESLKNRKSNDAYIPNLRKLQGQLLRLKQVQFTPDAFQAYRLNGGIATQTSPIKPRKKLILAFGIALGLFLGIFVAFIVEFIAKARAEDAGK